MSGRRRLDCLDCGRNADALSGHYYTLFEELWLSIAGKNDVLCLDCLEARLGRNLTEDMFVALPSEIMGRFAGERGPPGTPPRRQRDLDFWRVYIRGKESL
jgi:hypothetical protein